MGVDERRRFGCTVTAVNEAGERLTLARTGMTTLQALRQIVEFLERLDEGFRIETISSPVTIFRDLQGLRDAISDSAGSYSDEPMRIKYDGPQYPEMILLGRLGKRHLFQPPAHVVQIHPKRLGR